MKSPHNLGPLCTHYEIATHTLIYSEQGRHVRETDDEIEEQNEELPTPQRNSRDAPRQSRYQDDEDQEEATPAASAATSFIRHTTTYKLASRLSFRGHRK
ncbi:hypothetical protein LTR17_025148 [Elasticomyces elasticus]|nr:hypothetical protein LTR17_025148 [Elasticomyces elasticus]